MAAERLGEEPGAVAVVDPELEPMELARFCIDGLLLLERCVRSELNAAVLEDLRSYQGDKNRFWFASAAVQEAFAEERLAAVVAALLGRDPGYDHSSVHLTPAGFPWAQPWHQDSLIEVREWAFDLLLFYFPQDTTAEMGATLVLPGSHLRRVSNRSLARHHGFRGQRRLACPAGSVALAHGGLWHCGQPNWSATDRYMVKLRLRPGGSQRGAAAAFGRATAEVHSAFRASEHPWQGTEAGVDQVGYARLWRYLGGEGDVAPEGYLTRTGLDPVGERGSSSEPTS
jgi:hypothetical protein